MEQDYLEKIEADKQEYVEVPTGWFEKLKELTEGDTILPTAHLIGYLSSVDTILKYNKRIKK